MGMEVVFSTRSSKIGQWIFQRRGYLLAPFFVGMLFLPSEVPSDWNIFLGSLLLLMGAEGIRIWAVGYAGSQTRTRGDGVPSLFHSGPYRLVRNPLYLANSLIYFSMSALLGFPKLGMIVFLISSIQYFLIVSYEEELLQRTFGTPYLRYLEKVPRWVPLFSYGIEPTGEDFSLRKAIRSERTTLILITVGTIISTIRMVT